LRLALVAEFPTPSYRGSKPRGTVCYNQPAIRGTAPRQGASDEKVCKGVAMTPEIGKVIPVERPPARLHTIQIQTRTRVEFKDITSQIEILVAESGIRDGLCAVFTPHTTAAILINENADPALHQDFDDFLKRLAPQDEDYAHNDGNCDAHLKSALIGPSKTLLVENRRLILGTWQGVFLCEFDGPRRRELKVKIISD
jgi:secondary thiamine-phosphate synthase enzyme